MITTLWQVAAIVAGLIITVIGLAWALRTLPAAYRKWRSTHPTQLDRVLAQDGNPWPPDVDRQADKFVSDVCHYVASRDQS